MLLLELGSELPNLVKKFQFVLKIWTKCRLNFHEVVCTTFDKNELMTYKLFFAALICLRPGHLMYIQFTSSVQFYVSVRKRSWIKR